MFKSETKKKIKALGILFLLFGTTITCFNINQKKVSTIDTLIDEDINDKANILDIKTDILKTAGYSSNFSNTGVDLNITLHQSIVKEGTPLFEIANTSDPTNNSFNIVCPNVNSFNSTFSNITIENIFAPNKYLIVQDVNPQLEEDFTSIRPCATSFTVEGDGYIENVSVYIHEISTTDMTRVKMVLYNATWDSGDSIYIPGGKVSDYTFIDESNITASFLDWHTVTGLNIPLDNSKTEGNTWFIGLWDNDSATYPGDCYWVYTRDSGVGADGDQSDSVKYTAAGGGDWLLVNPSDGYADFHLRVGLIPESNSPLPTDINLKINNSKVNNIAQGSGFWENQTDFLNLPSKLDYEITAEWWDVSCNITKIQVNYTKTNLKAASSFKVLGSGQLVSWNASAGSLEYFDSDFNNYKINFTVPANWQDFQAFNGTLDNKTDQITLGPIVNRYRELQISNAGNGTNWFINATSTNLLHKIHTYVGLDEKPTTVNYTDTVTFLANFTETIIDGNINLSVYSPSLYLNHTYYNNSITPDSEIPLGDWTISDNATDNYGPYKVQVMWNNGTAAGFLEKDLIVMAVTELVLKSPPLGQDRFLNDIFNVTVFYNDSGYNSGDKGIAGATIDVNNTYKNIYNEGNGYYNIELNSSDYEFGWNYIEINASKTYYNVNSTIFSFHLRMNTTISPQESVDFGNVIRGYNVSYTFNYSGIDNNPILGAIRDVVTIPSGFEYSYIENATGPGLYTIKLNTSNVQASSKPYTCIFNITAIGKETKTITLNLTVILSQTKIKIIDYNDPIIRKDGLNQTILFYFNDTDNNRPILDLPSNNVTVIDSQTGLPRPIRLFSNGTEGYYILNVTVADLVSGQIYLTISISYEPNYNTSLAFIDFYLRGNLTQINMISLSDPDGQGTLAPVANNYSIFEGRELYVDFNITDTDYNNSLITSEVDSYLVEYSQIKNSTNHGILPEDLSFDANTNSFKGYISITELPRLGAYDIRISVTKTNYEEADISFNLIIKARYDVELSIVSKPDEITAGDTFKIILKAQYDNGTLMPLVDANIILIPYFDDSAQESKTKSTNDTGEVLFEITVSRTARNISLNIQIEGDYYHLDTSLQITDITVNPPPGGLTFKDLMPYLIIIGAAIAVVGASLGVYRGVVVPKKREKARVLTEVKTIFDDAINLEHVLVLHKGTGTCIYFKSFGSEAIDPELISGFISAISSFGKDLVSQEELNEISYGDKMLLLSDGEFIRIALVLSKKASIILRKNLKDLIIAFERRYENELPKWRGQLNIFREADTLIDDSLNTSIILPHEITYEFSTIKALKISHSRDVLKIANGLIKDSERNFFFIATLLKEASEKSSKDTAEIFMGIKELRDKKILMPIEISAIEAPPISQQEINLINQKVAGLVDLSPEEKQKLVNDLAQMGPAEREAYFASLAEQKEIISAPIETKPGAALIENMKDAKKEIAKLKKIAKDAKKKNDYENAIKINQNAAQIALNWELSREFTILDDTIRKIKIEDLKIKLKALENEAKNAAKEDNYNEAAQKYKMSSKIASEIFKLGVTDMTKEVKRLSNKSKEYEKLV
ncbi:MAG: hypothetical protein ACFFB0_18825 [Promethearchaeota archaeon]